MKSLKAYSLKSQKTLRVLSNDAIKSQFDRRVIVYSLLLAQSQSARYQISVTGSYRRL